MIRSRSTTFRTIIEHYKIGQFTRQIKHIRDIWHNALVHMFSTRNSQMACENWEWIDKYIIITPFYTTLHFRSISCTEETFTLCNSLSINLCTRRHHTRRIKLHLHSKSVEIKLSNLHSFQTFKIIASHLPHRQLLVKKLIYLILYSHNHYLFLTKVPNIMSSCLHV